MMKKIFIIGAAFVFFSAMGAVIIFPTEASSGQELKQLKNYKYYKISSTVDISIDLPNARPFRSGANLKMAVKLKNNNDFPVVDGSLYFKIFRKELNSIGKMNEFLVNQFFIAENISLDANAEKEFAVEHKLPVFLPSGQYEIDSYFFSAKKFELAGLTTTDLIKGGVNNFSIATSSDIGAIEFETENITLNGEPLVAIGAANIFEESAEVFVEVPVVNKTKKSQEIQIDWSVYNQNNLLDRNKIQNESYKIKLASGETKKINLKIPGRAIPVTTVVARADYLDTSAIVDIRFARKAKNKGRLNLAGISNFPIKADEKTTAFASAYATGGGENYQLSLVLKDRSEKIIETFSYNGVISGTKEFESEFNPNRFFDYFSLQASLKNSQGEILDEASLIYDCVKIDQAVCRQNNALMFLFDNFNSIIIFFIILIILAIAYWLMKKYIFSHKPGFPFLRVFIVGFILGGSYLFWGTGVSADVLIRTETENVPVSVPVTAFLDASTTPSRLDNSWGTGGWNTYGPNSSEAKSIAVDSDGNSYAAGYVWPDLNDSDWLIIKYNSVGEPDTSFGPNHDGRIVYDNCLNCTDEAHAIAIDSDRNIYVGGYITPNSTSSAMRWAIVKFNASGEIDTSWGGSGKIMYGAGLNNYVNSIVVDSEKNVYAAGIRNNAANGDDWMWAKYDSSGNTVFTRFYAVAGQDDQAWGIALGAQYLYVVGSVGTNAGDWAVKKISSSTGVVAATGGTVTFDSGGSDKAKGIAIDSNDDLYVAGYEGVNGHDWLIRKYDKSLNVVTGWGSSGLVRYSGGAQSDEANGIVVDSNKNIYIAGVRGTGEGDWMIRKYNSAGSLEQTWGGSASTRGYFTYSNGSYMDPANAIAIDSGGSVYVAGGSGTATYYEFNNWRVGKYLNSVRAGWQPLPAATLQLNFVASISTIDGRTTLNPGDSFSIDDETNYNFGMSSNTYFGPDVVHPAGFSLPGGWLTGFQWDNLKLTNGGSFRRLYLNRAETLNDLSVSVNNYLVSAMNFPTRGPEVSGPVTCEYIGNGRTNCQVNSPSSGGPITIKLKYSNLYSYIYSRVEAQPSGGTMISSSFDPTQLQLICDDSIYQGSVCADFTNGSDNICTDLTNNLDQKPAQPECCKKCLAPIERIDIPDQYVEFPVGVLEAKNSGGTPPEAQNLEPQTGPIQLPDPCAADPSYVFSWTYFDPDLDDYETQYQFQIDDNADFSSPEIDRTSSSLSNPSGTINEERVFISSASEPNKVQYGGINYNWRVKVWDSGVLGDGGPVIYRAGTVGGPDEMTYNSAVDSFGNLYIAGTLDTYDAVILKYTPAGALDTSWTIEHSIATDIIIDSANRIYVSGGDSAVYGTKAFVKRYSSSGDLDLSWGSAGTFTYSVTTYAPDALAFDSGGNVFVTGIQENGGGYFDTYILKLSPAGVLDPGWGVTGIVAGVVEGDDFHTTDMIVDPSNNVFISNGGYDGAAVIKFTSTGALDNSWSGDGIASVFLTGDYGDRELLRDGSGSIFISANEGKVAKFKTDGTLDTSWGVSGKIDFTPPPSYSDFGYDCFSLAQDDSSRLYLTCDIFQDAVIDKVYVARYDSQGVLDTSWGASGSVIYDFEGGASKTGFTSLNFVAPDKLYLVGTQVEYYYDIFAMRYNIADGSIDNSWGAAAGVSSSTWAAGLPFSTLVHAYPYADFIWTPDPPAISGPVDFISNGYSEISAFPATYLWTISDATFLIAGGDTVADTSVQFGSTGPHGATLQITDSDNQVCSKTTTFEVMETSSYLPKWIEPSPSESP